MAIKMKRGTTESWALGPEMVHWEDLKVQGKDSLIHCEGTNLQMNVYTASANYFYDENGQLENVKRPGLWLIQPGEIGWDASAQVEFKCQTDGPSDCWLEVAAPNAPSVHGQKIPLGQQAQMTVPYIGEWGLYIRWPDKGTVEIATIKISIRESQAYEELEEGQLGLEYAGDGNVKIKAGIPGVSKWDELPYIGAYTDLVPDYGTNLLPFNNISSHRQGNNDFIIEHKEGVFVFHGQVQPNKKEYLIFPVAPGPKSNLILKAGKTYCLKTHEEAPEDQFYLAFQSIWFSDGNYIDNDVIREYTPSVDTEVASISFSVHGSSLGTNYDNYQLALYLGEKENTPTFGRVNKALFPQKQSYTPEQQAQIRQNVQAAATQYIIELYSDGDTYYISETWSELEYLISLGLSFMLRYDGMLCYPDWEPSVEDAAFSFSTGDCGASTVIFLWKN